MVMKTVGTAELKARLSEHLRAVRAGEVITVLDRRTPIARIVPHNVRGTELVVRPAREPLRGFRLPAPVSAAGDVVDDLLALRRERL